MSQDKPDFITRKQGIKRHESEGLCVVISEVKRRTGEKKETWFKMGEYPIPFETRASSRA
jgi:hypothetical protein